MGGVLILGLGVVLYAGVTLKQWLADVRYYRARRIVRGREQ
jgi:hypothetical protein